LDPQAVLDVLKTGGNVQEQACAEDGGGARCAFFDQCPYQLQKKEAEAADVVIATHEQLLQPIVPKALRDNVGVIVIDESFWQKTLNTSWVRVPGFAAELELHPVLWNRNAIREDDTREQRERKKAAGANWVRSKTATEEMEAYCRMLEAALDQCQPGGFLTRAALRFAGLDAGACEVAGKLERRRVPQDGPSIFPGMDPSKRREAVEQRKVLPAIWARVRLWGLLREFLEGDDEEAGRLLLDTRTDAGGAALVVEMRTQTPIASWALERPILALDATMPVGIVRASLPRLEVLADVQVAAPHMRVRQVVGAWGKTALVEHAKATGEVNAQRRRHLADARAYVLRHAAGRKAAVISYKAAEAAFAGLPNIQTLHFNALAGLDGLKDAEVLFVIGQPLPRPEDIRAIALCRTGRAIALENPVRAVEGVLMADGTGRGVNGTRYADPDLEATRAAITDAEVAQALGRVRAVRRTEENPVELHLLSDVVTCLPVAELLHWRDVRPELVDRMAGEGVVLTSAADIVTAYPELEMTAAAVRKETERRAICVTSLNKRFSIGIVTQIAWAELQYRPAGRGQQNRRAWFSPALVPDPRAWLEQRLGPLAHFDLEDVPGAVAPAGAEQADPVEAVAISDPAMAVVTQAQPLTPLEPVVRVLPRPAQPLPNLKTRTTHWETRGSVLIDPSDLYPVGVITPPVTALFRVGNWHLVEQFQPPPLPKDDPRSISLALRIAAAVTASGSGLGKKPPILASAEFSLEGV
jgi:putative DNA primase/helicase